MNKHIAESETRNNWGDLFLSETHEEEYENKDLAIIQNTWDTEEWEW